MDAPTLKPAHEIARANPVRFPNESAAYRQARNALLTEEIELRRHIERVAELRRALPPGGLVNDRYRFVSEQGEVSLADLFGDKDTLVIYSYMFGSKRAAPCPTCTSFMSTWESKLPDVEQRVAFFFMARSPIDRLVAAKKARGWSRISRRLRHGWRLHAGLREPGGCRCAGLQCVHTSGRYHSPLLGQ
jgi:predicted dithiol-disulfide oxidoreductase (DUF899 family)